MSLTKLDATMIYAFTATLMTAWAHTTDNKRKRSGISPKMRRQKNIKRKKKEHYKEKPLRVRENSLVTKHVSKEMTCLTNFDFFT